MQAKASAIEADRRRGEAEAAGAIARDRLSRLNIATGTRYLDAGDADSALLWYARAWGTDNDPAAEEGHRLRVGAALAARPELVGLGIHNALVSDALFSPDGARILTRVEGPEAYIWDYERGRLAVPPLRHEAKVWHAAWSHDGTLVATASDDRTARIWDARDGRPIRTLRHPDGVRWLAFAPGSARLETACADGKVRTWDTASGAEAGPPLELPEAVQYVAYSGDGTKLLTADRSGTARVWDARSRKPLTPPLPHAALDKIDVEYGYRRYPAFSPDGSRLLTADKAVHVWDAATGERRLAPHAVKNRVTSLGWSPDGTRIVLTLDPVFAATILSARDGSVEAELRHPRAVQNAVFDPKGERLMTLQFRRGRPPLGPPEPDARVAGSAVRLVGPGARLLEGRPALPRVQRGRDGPRLVAGADAGVPAVRFLGRPGAPAEARRRPGRETPGLRPVGPGRGAVRGRHADGRRDRREGRGRSDPPPRPSRPGPGRLLHRRRPHALRGHEGSRHPPVGCRPRRGVGAPLPAGRTGDRRPPPPDLQAGQVPRQPRRGRPHPGRRHRVAPGLGCEGRPSPAGPPPDLEGGRRSSSAPGRPPGGSRTRR